MRKFPSELFLFSPQVFKYSLNTFLNAHLLLRPLLSKKWTSPITNLEKSEALHFQVESNCYRWKLLWGTSICKRSSKPNTSFKKKLSYLQGTVGFVMGTRRRIKHRWKSNFASIIVGWTCKCEKNLACHYSITNSVSLLLQAVKIRERVILVSDN